MEKHHSNQPSGSGNLLMRCMKKIPLAVGCAFAMLFCMSGVALASESYAQKIRVPVWEAEVAGDMMVRVMETERDRYNAGTLPYPVKDGMLEIEIGPDSSMIFEEKQLDF